MGALHAGHLRLVAANRERADRSIVTLFVNPKQFNNPADLAPMERPDRPARLLAAAHLGSARLIDNIPVEPAA